MFSVDNVREQIKAIRQDAEAGNTAMAVKAVEELVATVLQTDLPLFVMKSGGNFYIASAGAGDPRMFMRMFTHRSLADNYLENIRDGVVEEISAVESLQLSKFLFLRGVYGLVLNDGDEWVAMSLPDYIATFFDRILQQKASVNQAYVNCISLIAAVQKNSHYQLSYLAIGERAEAIVNGQLCCYIADRENKPSTQEGTTQVPLTLQALFKFQHRIIVCSHYLNFVLEDYTQLHKLLKAYNIVQQGTGQAVGFYDDPVVWERDSIDYHSVSDISLTYDTCQETAATLCTALVLTGENAKCPETWGDIDGSCETKSVSRTGYRKKESFFKRKRSVRIEKTQRSNRVDTTRDERGKYGGLFGAAIGILTLFMVLSLIGRIVTGMTDRHAIVEFRKALSDSAYAQAYKLYIRDEEYDGLLEQEINALVSRYAHNRLKTEEVKSALQAIAYFPGQTENLENASAIVARLEESKDAFTRGLQTEDVPSKLSCWIKVIPLDEEHYETVQAEINQNSGVWSAILLKEIGRYAYADKEMSCNYVNLGLVMFPQQEEFKEWKNRFSDELEQPALSEYPISIEEIELRKGANDTVTIYIKWRNESTKSFRSVDFYFAFLDPDGKRVTYQRRGEEKSIFQGTDSKAAPYEPGFETTSDTWGWDGVWKGYGNKVEQVKLTCVKVHYLDGAVDIFSLQRDLDMILSVSSTL